MPTLLGIKDVRAIAIVISLITSACGGESIIFVSDAGSTSDDAGASTPCEAYAQAFCAKNNSCTNGTNITRDWGDMSTCVAREMLACNDGLSAVSTGQTAALIEQCTAGMPTYACSDVIDGSLPTECNPAGPGAMGAPCTFNSQCASSYCSGNRNATCGTCAAPPAAGNSCAINNCAHGDGCFWDAANVNVCWSYVDSGAACGPDSNPPCAFGLTCAGASQANNIGGTCAPTLETLGETCGSKNMGLGCGTESGLWCTSKSGQPATCSSIAFAGDGMPCGYVNDGVVTQCTSGRCWSSGGPYFTSTGATSTGLCKAYASDGAACDTAIGPQCLTPARCVIANGSTSGVCTVPTQSVSASCQP